MAIAVLIGVLAMSAAAKQYNAPPFKGSEPRPGDANPAAMAHAPHYDDAALWPNLTGKEAFVGQRWPAARLLVWAGGDGKFMDPTRWLEDGKPAAAPPDENTDVVLPPAAEVYNVSAVKARCRHLTIGRNASVVGQKGSGVRGINVFGNCWVRAGGRIFFISPVGEGHTFLRRDDDPDAKPWRERPFAEYGIGDKMTVTKYGEGSVEFLGVMGLADEIYFAGGTSIVGPGAEIVFSCLTGNGTLEVYDGGTLQLQGGGAVTIARPTAEYSVSVYEGGAFQAGSPERPITRDCHVRVGPNQRRAGFFCAEGAVVRTHSADPEKARLVFESHKPGEALEAGGIRIIFQGEARLDGVLFDQVTAGGVLVGDLSVTDTWGHVYFGERNLVEGEGIYAKITGAVYQRDGSKHKIYVRPTLEQMEQFDEDDD